jgi:hypothetical protein
MATYYVANGGSDSAAGTSTGAPWLTLAHAFATCASGDTVNLSGSSTFSENPTLNVPITLQSYGTGQATISIGTGQGLYVYLTAGGLTINNVAFVGASYGYTGSSYDLCRINTSGASAINGITVSNCTFSNNQFGLRVYRTSTDNVQVTNVNVSNNTIFNIQQVGLYIHNAGGDTYFNYGYVTVANNLIYNIVGVQGGSGGYGWGIYCRACNTSIGPSTISGNLVHDTGGSAVSTGSGAGTGIGVEGCTGTAIQGNVVYNCISTGANNDASGFDIDMHCNNVVCEYNVAYNIDGGAGACFSGSDGAGATGNVYRWNLFVNVARSSTLKGTGLGGFRLDGDSAASAAGGYDFYNNTVISLSGQPCVWFDTSSTGPASNKRFFNNIFYCSTNVAVMNVPTLGSGFVLNGNAYYSGGSFSAQINGTNYTSLSAWQSATSMEANGAALTSSPFVSTAAPTGATVANLTPALANRLATGSSLYETAINLATTYSITVGSQDLFGNPIPAPYSVGAINPTVGFYPIGLTGGVGLFEGGML